MSRIKFKSSCILLFALQYVTYVNNITHVTVIFFYWHIAKFKNKNVQFSSVITYDEILQRQIACLKKCCVRDTHN